MAIWIDVGFVAVALICMGIGLAKGFTKQLFSLLKDAGTLVACFLLTPMLASFLLNALGAPESNFLVQAFTGIFAAPPFAAAFTSPDGFAEALVASGIPSFVAQPLSSMFGSIIPQGTLTLQIAMSYVCAIAVADIVVFIVLCLVITGIFGLLYKLFKLPLKIKALKGIDKILGMIVSLAVGYLIISVALAGIAFLPPDFATTIQTPVKELLSQTSLAKIMYEQNFLGQLLSGAFGWQIYPLI